jgi:hypothetical protein
MYLSEAETSSGRTKMPESQKKFDEWSAKIHSSLKKGSKSALGRLPDACRWLQYWGAKLRQEKPECYAKVERIEMRLLGQSAVALHKDYLSYLKMAQKHKTGTKARMVEILRYVYHYGNYVHPCLVSAGMENEAKEILGSFWKRYLGEIRDNKETLEDFQIQWILRLVKATRDLRIGVDGEFVSELEDLIKQPDPVLLDQCKAFLRGAEVKLNEGDSISALIQADQALELFLKDFCIRLGAGDYTSKSGKPFSKWGVVEYLGFLDNTGEITENEKRNFYSFHEWRNCAQHHGLEPSFRITKTVIDEVTKFIRERSAE